MDLLAELEEALTRGRHGLVILDEDGREFELIDVEPDSDRSGRYVLRIRPSENINPN